MAVLEVKNLTRQFGKFTAVDNISFTLGEGEILGLLGPNGAGKTTTIQMLLGVLLPTSGEVLYFDKSLNAFKGEILEQVNFSSTYTNLPWRLTVKENLTFISYLYNIVDRKKRLEQLVEEFELAEIYNKKMSDLSAGQSTRVNLAKSFLNNPKVLLLDEPTASMDPDIAARVREMLLEKRKKYGLSIIFTSHNMAEVEEVCDRVVFISQGRIVANNAPRSLAKSLDVCHINLLIRNEIKDAKKFCDEQQLPYSVQRQLLKVDVKEDQIAEFLGKLASKKIYYDEISIDKPSLEDFFLQIAKEHKQAVGKD